VNRFVPEPKDELDKLLQIRLMTISDKWSHRHRILACGRTLLDQKYGIQSRLRFTSQGSSRSRIWIDAWRSCSQVMDHFGRRAV